MDQRLVASVSYGHRVRASQSIVLQRCQGRFLYGTVDAFEAIERENSDHVLAVVVHDAVRLKC